jgi:hypothetical protein
VDLEVRHHNAVVSRIFLCISEPTNRIKIIFFGTTLSSMGTHERCSTLGCANKPRWLSGRLSTREVGRLCNVCITGAVLSNDFLVLVHSEK